MYFFCVLFFMRFFCVLKIRIIFENIRNSNVRNTTSFRIFLKIFEKGSSYREEFSVGTEKKSSNYRDVRVFECVSFRDFFASKGLVNSRDLEKSSTYRVVRVINCLKELET